MRRVVTNPVSYVLLYLAGMIPTYVLPYMGSNSHVARGAANAVASAYGGDGGTFSGPFYLHLFLLAGLIALAYLRGREIGKAWLVVFPVLAAVFDMAPLLNVIPLVPTVMHLLAIILGVAVASGGMAPAGRSA